MSKREFITVEELNYYINDVFLNKEQLHNVPVVGEVSGCSVVGGHCYFTLKDAKAQIKACLFNCAGKYVPHSGAKVLVRGSVDYYQKNGQINLKAYEVTYFGAGLLYLQYEQLKDKLEKEGLFREEHKLALPEFPMRVAIITSVQGAAVQDFITTVRRYNNLSDITVIDVRVQGESCVQDIVTALVNADDYGFDVIVLARGGGSYEDLFCFNDENLVRTVYQMRTPIISAIGHETDYTLCDFVSDYRAITPTAAAEKIGYSVTEMKHILLNKIRTVSALCQNKVDFVVDEFVDVCDEMQTNVNLILNNLYSFILKLLEKIRIYQNVNFNRENQNIREILANLERINPLKLLNNGYFRIILENEYVYKIGELKNNDSIKILGFDGEVNATINKED